MSSEGFKAKCRASKELQDLKPSGVDFWYPTVDELISLVKDLPNLKNVDDYHLLSKFRIGIAQVCCDNYLRLQTMADFWILYWMKQKTGKEWNNGVGKWL